jgi:hypothetical protein
MTICDIFFTCVGKINPPPNGKILTFASGSRAEIEWSYDPKYMITLHVWIFTNKAKTIVKQQIISVDGKGVSDINNSTLPGIEFKPPATLVFKSVDHRYNGFYEFSLITKKNGILNSKVEVIIAGKCCLNKN